jgi:hypothetical protein
VTLEPLEFVLLVLASYRITRFFVSDSLMGFGPDSGSQVSAWVDRFAYTEDGVDRSFLRGKLGDLLTCTWCLGFWVSLAALCAWGQVAPWELGTEGVLTAFAVAGGQGFMNSRMNA